MRRVAAVTALSLVCATVARAQVPGGLAGRVTDATGGAIAAAVVEVTGPAHKSATTDAGGAYRILGLPAGSYTVVVTRKQFAPFGRGDVVVAGGAVTTLDVKLEIAPREETETVEGEVPLGLEPTASAGAIVLKGADLEALPDDPDELADALQALAGPAAGPNGGQIYVDGFSSGRLPTKASIREIRINANPFSAEYDRLGFGRIEILTKPGTDRLRGNSELEFMDDALNSRDPFIRNRPPYQRREWGGNVGGPLAKKKGSFFIDFERRGVDDNQLVNATVLDGSLNPQPFSIAVLAPQHRTTFSPRIDWQLSPKTTLVARYSYTESSRDEAGVGGFSLPSRGYDTSNRQHMLQLTGTSILSNH
ncbi:MAG TPA: carboxypeptidase-like regulatory domain-containing protein, partial [Vicinamibacteria bacterium]